MAEIAEGQKPEAIEGDAVMAVLGRFRSRARRLAKIVRGKKPKIIGADASHGRIWMIKRIKFRARHMTEID